MATASKSSTTSKSTSTASKSTTTAAKSVSAPATNTVKTGVIQSGATLSSIASAAGTTVAALQKANPSITNANSIQAGAKINIPTNSSSAPASSSYSSGGSSSGGSSSSGGGSSSPIASTVTGGSNPNNLTVAQVKAIQVANGLNPDGIIGPLTQNALNKTTSTTSNSGLTSDSRINAIIDSLNKAANDVITGNQSINPALNITDDLVANFLTTAHSMVDPQAQELLTKAISDTNSSLQAKGSQYATDLGNSIQSFMTNLNETRNSAGAAGIGISGTRGLAEDYLQRGANRTLQNLATQTSSDIGNTLRSGALQVGGNNLSLNGSLSDFKLPSLNSASVDLFGIRGGQNTGSSLNYNYNPSDYSGYGSLSADYSKALTSSANAALGNYLGSAAQTSNRTFQNLNGIPTLGYQ